MGGEEELMNNKNEKSLFARLKCKCGNCNAIEPNADLIQRLTEIEKVSGITLEINSGVRCKKRNEEAGGKPNSAHLYGYAADIAVPDSKVRWLLLWATFTLQSFNRIGIYKTFIHVDCDESKPRNVVWVE